MKLGDKFTIAGVYEDDQRSRLRRWIDWIMRKPAPAPKLRVYTVTHGGTS